MLKIHKYFRFYPDPESYCTTLDGRRLLGIRPGLETLPPNKSPNKVASNFGPAGIPEWLESLKLAVIRDGDDAKASLKDFDYRFNSRTASSDVDQLVQPSTDNNPGVERQKRGERDKNLVKAALNRSVERIARDGAAARKKIAGVEKKVELTRKIQETVRRDANAASPGIKDHEFAKAWYVRLRTINSMYSRGKRIFHTGREWAKKTDYLTDAQIQMIISDITEQLLPPQNITMEDLCISAFTSGVNPSFLWFGLGPFYLEFEVFSFFGQLSLNPQAGEDFEKYEVLKSYLLDSITSPDNRGALWATRKSMMRFAKYMIYEHPAVATGRASPIVENAAVRLRGEPISIDVLFPRDVSKIV